MTKEQAEGKLALLGNALLTAVTVTYGDDGGIPLLDFSYNSIPGPGTSSVGIDLNPSNAQLSNLVDNLPIQSGQQLAALAIFLTPVLPGNE